MLKKKHLVFLLLITVLAILVRFAGRDLISEDMETAFLPWFNTMKNNGGLAALSKQIGDYGLLYQTVVALLTYIDTKPIYLYKIVPGFFDFLLAASVAYFITHYELKANTTDIDRDRKLSLSYAYVLLLPTVVWNSAYWGQCDSIYTFFLLWSMWFLYKEEYTLSFFALGCSLAFKLQGILLAPLFVYAFFSQRKFPLVKVLFVPVTFWLSGIVVYIYRLKSFDGVTIYSNQVSMFKRMWMNVPSFWVFMSDSYEKYHLIAIGLTFLILGLGLYMVISDRIHCDSFEQMLGLAVFIEWTCIVFLPAMHERYTYVMDLLLLMLVFVNRKYFGYAVIAIVTSCLTYAAYLFTNRGLTPAIVIVYIFAWLHYSYVLFSGHFTKIRD